MVTPQAPPPLSLELELPSALPEPSSGGVTKEAPPKISAPATSTDPDGPKRFRSFASFFWSPVVFFP
jgi:hypothetical protein